MALLWRSAARHRQSAATAREGGELIIHHDSVSTRDVIRFIEAVARLLSCRNGARRERERRETEREKEKERKRQGERRKGQRKRETLA